MGEVKQNKQTIIVISGPTASGKTSFSIDCAKKFNGEVLSCDSMQIYKHLDIGTAKATEEEQKQVKHYLIDIVEPNKDFSVEEYVKLARQKIDELYKEKKIPIIVGGTGFYIRSLIYDYSFCSATRDEEVRKKYMNLLEKNGKEYIYSLLQEKDLEASKKIHINDTKRVVRALEICELTGKNKTTLNCCDKVEEPIYNVIFVVLSLNREVLYNRINLRVDEMFNQGLLQEFHNCLLDSRVNKNCQAMQAIGYKELFDLNENNLNEVKELIKQHTRNYAKRQITFMKGFKDAVWFDSLTERDKALNYIEEKLKEYKNN